MTQAQIHLHKPFALPKCHLRINFEKDTAAKRKDKREKKYPMKLKEGRREEDNDEQLARGKKGEKKKVKEKEKEKYLPKWTQSIAFLRLNRFHQSWQHKTFARERIHLNIVD